MTIANTTIAAWCEWIKIILNLSDCQKIYFLVCHRFLVISLCVPQDEKGWQLHYHQLLSLHCVRTGPLFRWPHSAKGVIGWLGRKPAVTLNSCACTFVMFREHCGQVQMLHCMFKPSNFRNSLNGSLLLKQSYH